MSKGIRWSRLHTAGQRPSVTRQSAAVGSNAKAWQAQQQ